MRRSSIAIALLLVAGCDRSRTQPAPAGAGAALEAAAIDAGIATAPGELDPAGAYASATDHVCIVPAASDFRIGASVDYGEGQSCSARGRARGTDPMRVDFGEGCRIDATVDGDRITFPPTMPARCDRFCTGRASLAALTADRLSTSVAEASTMPGPGDAALCGS